MVLLCRVMGFGSCPEYHIAALAFDPAGANSWSGSRLWRARSNVVEVVWWFSVYLAENRLQAAQFSCWHAQMHRVQAQVPLPLGTRRLGQRAVVRGFARENRAAHAPFAFLGCVDVRGAYQREDEIVVGLCLCALAPPSFPFPTLVTTCLPSLSPVHLLNPVHLYVRICTRQPLFALCSNCCRCCYYLLSH